MSETRIVIFHSPSPASSPEYLWAGYFKFSALSRIALPRRPRHYLLQHIHHPVKVLVINGLLVGHSLDIAPVPLKGTILPVLDRRAPRSGPRCRAMFHRWRSPGCIKGLFPGQMQVCGVMPESPSEECVGDLPGGDTVKGGFFFVGKVVCAHEAFLPYHRCPPQRLLFP